jgi:hypothetical protein
MAFLNSRTSFVFEAVLAVAFLTLGAIPVSAQCDGLPHPENGQPAPCGQAKQSLPDPNSGSAWRAAQEQRQQQQQQEVAERQKQERDRVHKCELQAQHDYEECKQNNPNGYCPLKQCN